ncbi:PREDICTED: uncharacterized protein LOC104814270 isoform X2 [Tarenaya hassleriana]|uniref:uncharacterized protein LOC104814270 isoform X2 n=1 Tax=Tarenaya hassleriana TaxID=28532 RepID=UPI00053C48D8|nr:PREDICTED: uncharacterized protein LOC104814270 isoform X2 [Tarenaya hassleriana]
MPSGAKKRKALKKKKEKESIGIGNDDPESDGNLSSPNSRGNGEETHPSAFEKDKAETSVLVDSFKPHVSASEVVIFDDKDQVKTSNISSDSVDHKFGELEEKEKLKDGNLITPSEESAEMGKEAKSVLQSEIPECPEAKSLLASGPPVARTSWLSCCGLFDAMAGSER